MKSKPVVRTLFALLILVALSALQPAFSAGAAADNADRRFSVRMDEVVARTAKRVREVFGIRIAVKVVVAPTGEAFDMKTVPDQSGTAGGKITLLVNSRIVRDYQTGELEVAAGRALYQAVWPMFRKPDAGDTTLVRQLFDEAMTAYAAELLYPGRSSWTYAGIYGAGGRERYQQYLERERELAKETQQSLQAGAGGEIDADRRLLCYRLAKTFEKALDPKMIQLMDIAEFRQRVTGGLETLARGYGK